MNRRHFLRTAALVTLAGCGRDVAPPREIAAWLRGEVTLYDTHCMALYFDGTMGPKTGVMKVDYVLAGKTVELEFWHGHGGKSHFFRLTPDHFAEIKKLKRVTVETTVVDHHSHKLFIDPVDPRYRVPGAKPIQVPV